MEDSTGQKRKQREFVLASVSELSSSSSESPGISRFTSDGSVAELQIHQQSHELSLNVDLRNAQVGFCLV